MKMTGRSDPLGGGPRFHRLRTAAVAAGALLLSALAIGAQETVAPFCYTAMTHDVRVVVDVSAARHRSGEKFIPLMVYVGCWGSKALHLNQRSFALEGPDGAVSPLATREQIQDKKLYGYFRVADDYAFLWNNRDRGPVRMAFNGLGYMTGTCFYPNVGGVPYLLRDEVDLIPYSYTRVLLYFANPLGKADGVYLLSYRDPRTGIEVRVPFRIRWD
jgi:hypothetical protein